MENPNTLGMSAGDPSSSALQVVPAVSKEAFPPSYHYYGLRSTHRHGIWCTCRRRMPILDPDASREGLLEATKKTAPMLFPLSP